MAESADTEAVRLATISAEIREYLIAETDVTMPNFHATALTHRIAPLLRPANTHAEWCTPDQPCAGGLCDGSVDRFIRNEGDGAGVVTPPG